MVVLKLEFLIRDLLALVIQRPTSVIILKRRINNLKTHGAIEAPNEEAIIDDCFDVNISIRTMILVLSIFFVNFPRNNSKRCSSSYDEKKTIWTCS